MSHQVAERQIVESIDIAAPPERVFRALTDAAELLEWWGGGPEAYATHWEIEPRCDGKWLSRWSDLADETEFELGGVVQDVCPPKRLILSWWDERYPGLEHTTVRYEIERLPSGGSRLRLTHSGFEGTRPDFDDYNRGWSTVTSKLRAYTEAAEAADPHVKFKSNRDLVVEVSDLDPAEDFYGGTLGFSLRSRGEKYLQFDTGALTLWVNCTSGPRGTFIPSLEVEDAARARAVLEAAGCRIVAEAEDGRGFYFEDPFGFVLDVVERGGARD